MRAARYALCRGGQLSAGRKHGTVPARVLAAIHNRSLSSLARRVISSLSAGHRGRDLSFLQVINLGD